MNDTKPKFYCRMDAAGSLQECATQCSECASAESGGKVNRQKQGWSIEFVAFTKSENGRDNWQPVSPELVPADFKNPDILGYMLEGNQAMDTAGDQCWYRAHKLEQHASANDETRPQ